MLVSKLIFRLIAILFLMNLMAVKSVLSGEPVKNKQCDDKFSNDEIIAIARKELNKMGITGGRNSRIVVYRYDCDYIYREEYLPERPGDWFAVVINPSGVFKEFIPGR